MVSFSDGGLPHTSHANGFRSSVIRTSAKNSYLLWGSFDPNPPLQHPVSPSNPSLTAATALTKAQKLQRIKELQRITELEADMERLKKNVSGLCTPV